MVIRFYFSISSIVIYYDSLVSHFLDIPPLFPPLFPPICDLPRKLPFGLTKDEFLLPED